MPQPDLQFAGIEMRVPRTHSLVRIVEHAHQLDCQGLDVACARVYVGPRNGARGRKMHVTEVGSFAGASRRAG